MTPSERTTKSGSSNGSSASSSPDGQLAWALELAEHAAEKARQRRHLRLLELERHEGRALAHLEQEHALAHRTDGPDRHPVGVRKLEVLGHRAPLSPLQAGLAGAPVEPMASTAGPSEPYTTVLIEHGATTIRWNEVERHAERAREHGLDAVGVRHRDDDLAGMRLADPLDGVGEA